MKKIPNNAKRVFKGVIFDVYQWEQEVFDGMSKLIPAWPNGSQPKCLMLLPSGFSLASPPSSLRATVMAKYGLMTFPEQVVERAELNKKATIL